jgi:hypothetical protein
MIQITGPDNYVTFDVVQVKVTATSQTTVYYDWTIPDQSGAYLVTVDFLLPRTTALDSTTIQVT